MQLRKNRYVSYYDASIDDDTLDNELASDTSDGLMSKEDKMKLDKINITEEGGVKIPADKIDTTEDKQFMSKEDKKKLDELEVNDEGSIVVSVENIATNENKQFVTNEQITKIESSISIEYNADEEAFVFF